MEHTHHTLFYNTKLDIPDNIFRAISLLAGATRPRNDLEGDMVNSVNLVEFEVNLTGQSKERGNDLVTEYNIATETKIQIRADHEQKYCQVSTKYPNTCELIFDDKDLLQLLMANSMVEDNRPNGRIKTCIRLATVVTYQEYWMLLNTQDHAVLEAAKELVTTPGYITEDKPIILRTEAATPDGKLVFIIMELSQTHTRVFVYDAENYVPMHSKAIAVTSVLNTLP